MTDFFAPYSGRDRELAAPFVDRLASHGFSTVRDVNMPVAAKFLGFLGREIHKTERVIVVRSDAS